MVASEMEQLRAEDGAAAGFFDDLTHSIAA